MPQASPWHTRLPNGVSEQEKRTPDGAQTARDAASLVLLDDDISFPSRVQDKAGSACMAGSCTLKQAPRGSFGKYSRMPS
jgi:hypothetical protein